jgi:hypothetical protein
VWCCVSAGRGGAPPAARAERGLPLEERLPEHGLQAPLVCARVSTSGGRPSASPQQPTICMTYLAIPCMPCHAMLRHCEQHDAALSSLLCPSVCPCPDVCPSVHHLCAEGTTSASSSSTRTEEPGDASAASPPPWSAISQVRGGAGCDDDAMNMLVTCSSIIQMNETHFVIYVVVACRAR